jgi:hypothetical protein
VELHLCDGKLEVMVTSVEGVFTYDIENDEEGKPNGTLAMDVYRHPFAYRKQAKEILTPELQEVSA